MVENDKTYEAYEKIIKENCDNEIDFPIPNSTMTHAFIGIQYLIKKAKNNIRIVSECFFEDFWRDLHPFIAEFLNNRTGKLEVIVIKECNKEGVLKNLIAQFPQQVTIFDFKNKTLENKAPNFLTIDQKGYRFELSDEKKKDRLVEGVINFGDTKGTTALNSFFDVLKSGLTPIAIPC